MRDGSEHADGAAGPGLAGVVEELSDAAARTRRLVELESRRRELLHRLVRAGEEARRQLAADLHDGPVQVLTATAMRLEVLGRSDDPPPWTDGALATVRQVNGQLRDLLYDLHPQLSGGDLHDTIRHLAVTVLPGARAKVVVEGAEPAPPVARSVHGVIQEALWELREQAEPDGPVDAIDVRVYVGETTVEVVVARPGSGEPLLTRAGLLAVHERCEAAGGVAALEGEGHLLRCTIPHGGTR